MNYSVIMQKDQVGRYLGRLVLGEYVHTYAVLIHLIQRQKKEIARIKHKIMPKLKSRFVGGRIPDSALINYHWYPECSVPRTICFTTYPPS